MNSPVVQMHILRRGLGGCRGGGRGMGGGWRVWEVVAAVGGGGGGTREGETIPSLLGQQQSMHST